MPRKTQLPRIDDYVWLAEAGRVFVTHSLQLAARPQGAPARLAKLGAEKQRAFSEGLLAAGWQILQGAPPRRIARAAMAPVKGRVRSNARRLSGGW